MPARNPEISEHSAAALADIGEELRRRRLALGVSAARTAEAAGMSRVTMHRIEAGSPAVTIGAYLNAAAALGLRFTLDTESSRQPSPHSSPTASAPPTDVVRVSDFPQLRAIAWQLAETSELTGAQALDLYERNWRHVDRDALTDAEITFIRRLVDTYGAGVLLV